MADVEVKISNPENVKLTVSATMPAANWQEILKRLEPVPYYGPLDDLLTAVRRGINDLWKRELIALGERKEEGR